MTSFEAAAILTKHWSSCPEPEGLVMALRELGAIKTRDPMATRELELVQEALEEAAFKLENFSTNSLYHKALLRGAKIIRDLKHDWEMRSLSTLRQGGEAFVRGDFGTANGPLKESR